MTEPPEIAAAAEEVVPGLWTWSISNSNIGGHTSTSQAVLTREGCLLIDPVRLDDAALAGLPRPLATLLTSRGHQRAAWRYREELGAEVWLPEDASAADEQPDHTYADGQLLPGGLRAFRTPGPEWPHYSFLYEGDPGVVFCSDLVSSDAEGLHFINPAFHRRPRGHAGERGTPAGPAVRDPVFRPRRSGGRRPQGGAARVARAERLTAARPRARRPPAQSRSSSLRRSRPVCPLGPCTTSRTRFHHSRTRCCTATNRTHASGPVSPKKLVRDAWSGPLRGSRAETGTPTRTCSGTYVLLGVRASVPDAGALPRRDAGSSQRWPGGRPAGPRDRGAALGPQALRQPMTPSV